jgi:hypothetical protein
MTVTLSSGKSQKNLPTLTGTYLTWQPYLLNKHAKLAKSLELDLANIFISSSKHAKRTKT